MSEILYLLGILAALCAGILIGMDIAKEKMK